MGNLLHVRDEQTSGTDGGTSVTGADNIRVLNTVVTNTITGASLSSNQVTLPAGTYDIFGSVASWDGDRHRVYLYNVTDANKDILGPSGNLMAGVDSNGGRPFVMGRITLAAEKVFELRHYTQNGVTNTGLGIASDDGEIEVWAELFVEEVV